jgi:hypothetical protein
VREDFVCTADTEDDRDNRLARSRDPVHRYAIDKRPVWYD